MILLDIDDPKGCFECECRLFYRFDSDESHYICPLIKLDENTYKEVSDDGERDEKCPIVDEITDGEYHKIICHREQKVLLDKIRAREKATGKKIVSDDELSTPVYLED